MIIAHAAPLSYLEFARMLAPLGVVNLGLTVVILRRLFRQDLQNRRIALRPRASAVLDRPLLIRTFICLPLVLVGFVIGLQLAWTALGGATLPLLISGRPPRQLMAEVDGPLLRFFGALFAIVASLDTAGVPAKVSTWVLPLFHAPGPLGVVHFAWVSVLASNLISNGPYVLAAASWVEREAHPQRLWLRSPPTLDATG
jgi:Na+/H+ antiporter NhaD/arsenite permease-like protein